MAAHQEERQCAACHNTVAKDEYSKAQWGNGESSVCQVRLTFTFNHAAAVGSVFLVSTTACRPCSHVPLQYESPEHTSIGTFTGTGVSLFIAGLRSRLKDHQKMSKM